MGNDFLIGFLAAETISHITERRKSDHKRGRPPNREGKDYIVDIESVFRIHSAALGIDYIVFIHSQVTHKGQGVPCRNGSRIGGVDKTVVTGSNADSTHSLSMCSALFGNTSETIYRIWGICTVTSGRLRLSKECQAHEKSGNGREKFSYDTVSIVYHHI